jgi:hypothetical protein
MLAIALLNAAVSLPSGHLTRVVRPHGCCGMAVISVAVGPAGR